MATLLNLNSKAHVQGDALPPSDGSRVRIFSMRFCPWAARALLTASVKRIPAEVVNISFKSKPEWFLQRSPFGTTPAAEYKGMVVFDSSIVAEWLDRLYASSEPRLLPDDANECARQRMVVERLMRKLGRWAVVVHGPPEQLPHAVSDIKEALLLAEALLTDQYFAGATIGWSDIMLWSFFERLPVVDLLHADAKLNDALLACGKLSAYVHKMRARPDVKAVAHDPETLAGFTKTYLAGDADYDYGL